MTRSGKLARLALRATTFVLLVALLVPAGGAGAERRKKEKEEQGSGLDRRVAEKLLTAYELFQDDKFDKALAIVDGLARRRNLRPAEIAQIHRFRGYIFVSQGKNEEAAAEFEKALAQKGLDRAAEQVTTYSLAQIHTQLGRYDRALELIETWFASEESPKADAYYLKAMILVQQEDFAAALEPAQRAVEMEPSPRESWLQLLVAIYSNLKDFPNVAATLERLVAVAPGKKQYWIQLAAVQHFLERDARALAALRLAHHGALLNEDRDFRQLGRLLYLRELPYQCATAVEGAVSAGTVTGDADSWRLVANCYIAARENDRALAPLAKAAELAPDGETYMLLGQIHLQAERFEEALDALQKSLAKSKPERRGAVHLLIGVAQLGSDRFDDAERSFRAAQADAKTRRAADSYLTFLEQERARSAQRDALRTAARD
jgi:tetratricopeptide (TPR) repeat protein